VSPYDYLEAREKERDANESARVLYVAATRVQRKLHLVGIASQNAKGEINPTKNTYLDLLWNAVGQTFEEAGQVGTLVEQGADISDFTPCLVRLKQPQLPAILQTERSSIATAKQNNKPSNSVSIEADIGTLAHRYMEIIAKQGLPAWPSPRIGSLLPAMRHWLRQQGHAAGVANDAATQVEHLLTVTLNSPDGQWVLGVREGADAELGLSKFTGDEVKNHIVDRTFVDNGVRWIIDYKTGELPADATAEVLQSAAEAHREQLQTYAALFESEGLPISCAVFFMHAGRLVNLCL
jgi:ATP-dependent exoDNAse (exonuclease V) beta subunit